MATNTERIDVNTTAIRKLETAVEVQRERLRHLDSELQSLTDELLRLREQREASLDRAQSQSEVHARHDERLKQLEQQLERRWNLLLVLAGALAGVVFSFLATFLSRLT